MEKKKEENVKPKTKLEIKELEKKVLPSVLPGKKGPDIPYAPGTDYGLASRANLLKFNS